MRKLCFWATVLSICLPAAITMSAPPYWAIPPGGLAPGQDTALADGDYPTSCSCADEGVRGGPRCSCRAARQKHSKYAAAQACFNCACQGSYKFPVPPQSTYFWPGMYSQKTAVDYNMPYRYPMLELPRWDEPGSTDHPPVMKPVLQQTSLELPAVERPEPQAEPELTSRRIDWLHKLW